jgi:hypothetical protein
MNLLVNYKLTTTLCHSGQAILNQLNTKDSGSNPFEVMDICKLHLSVMLFCVRRGLIMGQSPTLFIPTSN